MTMKVLCIIVQFRLLVSGGSLPCQESHPLPVRLSPFMTISRGKISGEYLNIGRKVLN